MKNLIIIISVLLFCNHTYAFKQRNLQPTSHLLIQKFNESVHDTVKIYSYSDNVYIRYSNFEKLEGKIEVYKSNGDIVMREKLHSQPINKYKIDAESGIYLIRVIIGKKIYTNKVFIKSIVK